MLFGPFSSLITGPTASVAARYGFAMIEGAGGAPAVFDTPSNQARHNVFDVSCPIVSQLEPIDLLDRVAAGQPAADDRGLPGRQQPVHDPARAAREGAAAERWGSRPCTTRSCPAEVPDFKSAADQVAATHAQAVFLGSVDVPTVAAFMQAFEQQHYNPKIMIAAAGPGSGHGVPHRRREGQRQRPDDRQRLVRRLQERPEPGDGHGVHRQVRRHAPGINADVAEAYGVGQVAAQAIKATGGTTQAKIIPTCTAGSR